MATRRKFIGTIVAGTGLLLAPRLRGQGEGVGSATKAVGSLLHGPAAWSAFLKRMSLSGEGRAHLAREADPWLAGKTISITAKTHPAPSGDPHDYVSIAPYRWPDPAKPDGLPWIERDGRVNPAFYDYDNPVLERFCSAVPRLVLQAYASGSAVYAERAGKLLRAWFLDPETRMNPNLRYAQGVPGLSDGSSTGIIDATSLVFLADAASRLSFNREWTTDHLKGVKAWFARYSDWLLTSVPGRKEGRATNNHGSWYDAQVACFSVFCDRPEVARRQIERETLNRIAKQVDPDGRQPAELRRTLALTYSTYNLLAHACTAQAAAAVGIDLWGWRSPDGRSLRTALRWLEPYYAKQKAWDHPQIHSFDFTSAAPVLNLAWETTGDPELARLCDSVEAEPWQRLLFSKAALAGRQVPRPV